MHGIAGHCSSYRLCLKAEVRARLADTTQVWQVGAAQVADQLQLSAGVGGMCAVQWVAVPVQDVIGD